jgi:polyhydroxybutyrate depolymerase
MACEAADVITGIASIAGSISVGDPCTPSRPVSVLLIHGTDDADISYTSGSHIGGAEYLGAEALLQDWVTRDECPGPPSSAEPVDFDLQIPGAETTRTSWTGCAAGTRVDFWKMQDSQHIPPFSPAAKDAILARLLGF